MPAETTLEVRSIEGMRGWFVALGIGLMILGFIALGAIVFTTWFSVILLGALLLAAGIGVAIHAARAPAWGPFLLQLSNGVLIGILGAVILARPAAAAAALTLVVGAFMLVSGFGRILIALASRPTGWGLLLFGGIVAGLLGLVLLMEWPLSGLWAIGLFVGVDLVFYGAWFLATGLSRRAVVGQRTATVTP
jgi:uncharacterized membrane protein HdeD (DUF308 family)